MRIIKLAMLRLENLAGSRDIMESFGFFAQGRIGLPRLSMRFHSRAIRMSGWHAAMPPARRCGKQRICNWIAHLCVAFLRSDECASGRNALLSYLSLVLDRPRERAPANKEPELLRSFEIFARSPSILNFKFPTKLFPFCNRGGSHGSRNFGNKFAEFHC